jgi:3-vinyl bacteriochlorophyllide hydratase
MDGFKLNPHDGEPLQNDGRGGHIARTSAPKRIAIFSSSNVFDYLAPSPWVAHAGSPLQHRAISKPVERRPLYSPQERQRRDRSPWTLVQAILAPLQFLAFIVSIALVARYLITGRGYEIATASILIKTTALYTIMITGSIWEKEVFGKWLFAPAFFWEDVFSMVVLSLQTAYVSALILGWGTPRQQIMISVAAYAAYAINAFQFLWKLRQARLEAPHKEPTSSDRIGQPA